MALISCPECSREISDKAESCPQCGFPTLKMPKPPKIQTEQTPTVVNCLECEKEFPFADEVCPHCGLFNSQKYTGIRQPSVTSLISMTWVSEEDAYIMVKCPQCSKVSKIKKHITQKTNTGYKLEGEGVCACGAAFDEIFKDPKENRVKCPSCGSFEIAAGNRGFGLGKAAAGGVLLGPVGLLGGIFGSKKTVITCLQCGHKWAPGT